MPENEQLGYFSQGYELEDDGKPDIVWVRNRKDNKCYEVSWERLHNLQEKVSSFVGFIMKEEINAAPVIERPETWYPVDTTE